ncbi:hypothetical protein MTX26_22310 [Bradyrhizobium sp. ISRA443]|uniref:hypothetical protein n=1 Tax=unclassified Bradyrhizobium TaxID=2631580 RepID=UPI00247A9D34|nr:MULTISPECIES: hypothetical protein [unclassified Bradyrhizobium]WGR92712.1 hypothetical protein MTX20_33090 [Bradyrhizobium sp. ISRA435]WGR97162.1 hypothetical protein MTX23_22310 [Bradyrhizobium sp. ISRA436]WGS04050.1 hypothetical protein MTX18_22310 [Bradyrhizobium sp. ISRA437]WGS10933.1 hypothetical protein MTX26_22310 [Bradyrhizobium sp. ISRA443]
MSRTRNERPPASPRCGGLRLLPFVVTQPAARGATASTDAASEDTSLLYLNATDWEKQPAPRKIALAADFMRIFCTDQTMSPASLAHCLDRDKADGALFERAIACVSAISAGR